MALTYSAQQVIQAAQELEPMEAIRAMQYLNEAHLYITTRLHLVPDQTELFTMVDGQQEYTLPDGVATIWDAAYWTGGFTAGGTNYKPLRQTNVDTLFEDSGPNWQLRPASMPWGYYERGGMIGFVPAPTAAGDQVEIFYTPATILTLTSTLPTNISSCYPWVYHMCRRACMKASPEKRPFYEQAFNSEMDLLSNYINQRMGRNKPRVATRVARVRGA